MIKTTLETFMETDCCPFCFIKFSLDEDKRYKIPGLDGHTWTSENCIAETVSEGCLFLRFEDLKEKECDEAYLLFVKDYLNQQIVNIYGRKGEISLKDATRHIAVYVPEKILLFGVNTIKSTLKSFVDSDLSMVFNHNNPNAFSLSEIEEELLDTLNGKEPIREATREEIKEIFVKKIVDIVKDNVGKVNIFKIIKELRSI